MNGQLFVMLFSWADNFFWFDDRVQSLEPEVINDLVIDDVANPDFAHACAEQSTHAPVDFHIQLARIANEDELPFGKSFHQSRNLFDLVIVGPAERATNGIDQERARVRR